MSPVQFSSQFSLLRNFLSLKENLSSKQKLLESLLKFPVQFRGGAGDNQIITCSLAAAAVYVVEKKLNCNYIYTAHLVIRQDIENEHLGSRQCLIRSRTPVSLLPSVFSHKEDTFPYRPRTRRGGSRIVEGGGGDSKARAF